MANSRLAFGWLIAILAMAISTASGFGADLGLLPPSARLVGPHARQRFIVERSEGPVGTADVTSKAAFTTDNPRVATVDANGFVIPAGDGLATLSATVDGQAVRATISVEEHDRDESWSFRNHVEPVLTKQGCNSGACHGAAAGKNGLRLTLRGYGPEVDHAVLTRQALGRRVDQDRAAGEPVAAEADGRHRTWRRRPLHDRFRSNTA